MIQVDTTSFFLIVLAAALAAILVALLPARIAPPVVVAGVRGRGARVVVTHAGAVVTSWALPCRHPDLGMVEDLARLALAARRIDCAVHVQDASAELAAVLELVGLADVLTPASASSALGKVEGEAELGEQPGVDEVVVPDDPVA